MPPNLPGKFIIQRGTRDDYIALEHFHYLPKRPRTWAGIWRIVHRATIEGKRFDRLIAVGVLSWPIRNCAMRYQVLRLHLKTRRQQMRFLNASIRTISRVIVHPQYRSLGLASMLVRCICRNCPTRYVEASAVMGRAHPFFDKAGMTRINPFPPTDNSPVYFIFDRSPKRPAKKNGDRQCKTH